MQVVINDLITTYKTYGDPAQKCVVILHGWGRSLADWEQVSTELSALYFVVSLDLPGFGGTQQPTKPYSIFDYADFVNNFFTKLNLTPYCLLGHSFGGRIGIILGAKSPNFEKLILVDPGGTEIPNQAYKAFLALSRPLAKVLPKKIVSGVKKLFGSTDYLQAGNIKDIFIKVINQDLGYMLPNIHPLTLTIWGSADTELNVELSKQFRDKIPNGLLKIFWGIGHHPHLESPQEFILEIKDFLDA